MLRIEYVNEKRKPTRFAAKLRAARIAERITQKQLANRHGVDSVTISRYERDASPVGIPWLAPILSKYAGTPAPTTSQELEAAIARANPRRADVDDRRTADRRTHPRTALEAEAIEEAEGLEDQDDPGRSAAGGQ